MYFVRERNEILAPTHTHTHTHTHPMPYVQAVVNGDVPKEMAMDIDPCPFVSEGETLVDLDRNPVAIEKVLGFGRDLQAHYSRLTTSKPNEQLKTLLQVGDMIV